jgi:DNA-binding NtrC family response regulator
VVVNNSGTALAGQAFVTDFQNQHSLSARSIARPNRNPFRPPIANRNRAKPEEALPRPGADAQAGVDAQEFEQFLEHAASLSEGGASSLRSWLELAEAWQITRSLKRCRGNRSATARELGIGRRTLYAKMDKLGITASWGV